MVQGGGWSPTTLWDDPRRPACDLVQNQSGTEVSQSVQQGFLGAGNLGKADRSPFVSAEVVVDPVDLE